MKYYHLQNVLTSIYHFDKLKITKQLTSLEGLGEYKEKNIMAKNYYVSGNRKDGYKAVGEGAQRASFTGKTQAQVINQTRQSMRSNGGGELRIQGTDGKFRAADTVPPKKDNFPPRG